MRSNPPTAMTLAIVYVGIFWRYRSGYGVRIFFFDPPTSVALSPSNQDFNSPTSVALGNLSQDFQLTDVGDFGSPRIKDFNSPTSVALGLSQNFNLPTSVTLGGLGVRISTYRRR